MPCISTPQPAVSTASPKAAAAYDHLVTGYLTYGPMLAVHLRWSPDFALALHAGPFRDAIGKPSFRSPSRRRAPRGRLAPAPRRASAAMCRADRLGRVS